jgi:hypothetical protein
MTWTIIFRFDTSVDTTDSALTAMVKVAITLPLLPAGW